MDIYKKNEHVKCSMSITQSGKTGFCKSTKKIFHHMGTNVCAKVFVVFIFSL